jgi:hypothetical protein
LLLGRILASMWEGSRDFVPSLRFDVVPQPAVHNVILVHFCPNELFVFVYSGHVFDRYFVLAAGRLFVSVVPGGTVYDKGLGKSES